MITEVKAVHTFYIILRFQMITAKQVGHGYLLALIIFFKYLLADQTYNKTI